MCFQYAERIKSELILASALIWRVVELGKEQRAEAGKLVECFLLALRGEIRIASNALKIPNFEEAGGRVEEAIQHVRRGEYPLANRLIAEAISRITTSGQRAIETLKMNGLL